MAQRPKALLGCHYVAKLIALREGALNGGRNGALVPSARVDVLQLSLMRKALRCHDVCVSAGPLHCVVKLASVF
jgi:hypothetical protein